MKNFFLKIVLIFVVLIITISTESKAGILLTDTIDKAESFVNSKDSNAITIDETKVIDLSQDIYTTLNTIGVVIAVGVFAFLGVQYIIGSVEQQAKVKETLIPFAIGCFVVFGAVNIWRIAVNIVQGL